MLEVAFTGTLWYYASYIQVLSNYVYVASIVFSELCEH